jgi:hypothetical protein
MYSLYAYVSRYNNIKHSLLSFIIVSLVGAFPLWSFVSRVSKNLLFDGLLYDSCMLLSFVITFILLGEGKAFNLIQWFGLISCIMGLILMKVGG